MKAKLINNKTISIEIDASLFPEQVVFKCFYWYSSAYSISITQSNMIFLVELISTDGDIFEERFEQLIRRIKSDLIDYKTRSIIHTETNNIKQILIAKAFSSFDDFEESPKGKINDPMGFKIE